MFVRDARSVIDALSAMIDDVFTQVGSVRDRLADCFLIFGEDPLTRRDIASIQPRLKSELHSGAGLLRGVGVALSPGLLMDARLWIDWWVIDNAGRVQATVFDFDADSLDYYDYTTAEWYLAPSRGEDRSLVGPYVDFSGLNDYIVTATTPVSVDGRFVGVAGADLRVDEIERRLYTANRRFGGELVVVNSSDRIVASTSTRYIVGSLFRPNPPPPTPYPRQRLAGVSWSVIVLG